MCIRVWSVFFVKSEICLRERLEGVAQRLERVPVDLKGVPTIHIFVYVYTLYNIYICINKYIYIYTYTYINIYIYI